MEQYECELCNKNFFTLSNYRQHLRTKKHQKGQIKQEKFFCGACQYETTVKRDYRSHLLSMRHERNFRNKRVVREGFCECCDFDAGCHSKLQRHQQTRQHVLSFEKFCRLSSEKLKKLEEDILECLLNEDKSPFTEQKKAFSVDLCPVGLCKNPKNVHSFFLWIKTTIKTIEYFVKDDEQGVCVISWVNHKHKMSRGDFMYLMLSLADRVRENREKFTKREVERRVSEGERATFCFDGQNGPEFESVVMKYKNLCFEQTHHALRQCEMFWRWWNEEKEFHHLLRQCSLFLRVEEESRPSYGLTRTLLEEDKFLDVLCRYSARTREEYKEEILALSFLSRIENFLSPSSKPENCPKFYLAFSARRERVTRDITASYFNMGKPGPFSARVVSILCERTQKAE
ncbi:putative zinc finger protein [Tokyovirus A1]|uniref:putative zinc finger protein n=1 Tax=Tokyovirus A1 TaxID=1826170 RepID=UPI0007A96405|nr:putative zinc finger protein [Tokyovirus A1]BAU80314.1 putative zinc finger protein [Tokyovirus A1]